MDAKRLIESIVEIFHRQPLRIHTDLGTQFTSVEFQEAVAGMRAEHIKSAREAHWSNGRVERTHRFINEYIRTHHQSGHPLTYPEFISYTKGAVYQWNTMPRDKFDSPFSQVFRFPAVDPLLPKWLRKGNKLLWAEGVETVETGETVSVRRPGMIKKAERRYEPGVVVNSRNNIVEVKLNKRLVDIHSTDIKKKRNRSKSL